MSERYEPFFTADTDGVHFEIGVGDRWVGAYIGRRELARVYGLCESAADCMEAFRVHEQFLRDAAMRRVQVHGPETVILNYDELIRIALASVRPCAQRPETRELMGSSVCRPLSQA